MLEIKKAIDRNKLRPLALGRLATRMFGRARKTYKKQMEENKIQAEKICYLGSLPIELLLFIYEKFLANCSGNAKKAFLEKYFTNPRFKLDFSLKNEELPSNKNENSQKRKLSL